MVLWREASTAARRNHVLDNHRFDNQKGALRCLNHWCS